jgi:hypothetical protein
MQEDILQLPQKSKDECVLEIGPLELKLGFDNLLLDPIVL